VATLKSSSRVLQRQLDLITAVCQERLLATHVRHIVALVDLVADRVPFDDALDIYVRIIRLPPEQARNIGSRALAELGRRERAAGRPAALKELAIVPGDDRDDEDAETESSQPRMDALFARLRRRVRGRVQEDLRQKINLAAARAEDDLLQNHVENAMLFVRGLAKDLNEGEAVELYLETMMLPEGVADVVYHRVLRRVADKVLPPLPQIADAITLEQAERRIELTPEEAQR